MYACMHVCAYVYTRAHHVCMDVCILPTFDKYSSVEGCSVNFLSSPPISLEALARIASCRAHACNRNYYIHTHTSKYNDTYKCMYLYKCKYKYK
jgi:hypothetical protein